MRPGDPGPRIAARLDGDPWALLDQAEGCLFAGPGGPTGRVASDASDDLMQLALFARVRVYA
jgi:hypothetical protein